MTVVKLKQFDSAKRGLSNTIVLPFQNWLASPVMYSVNGAKKVVLSTGNYVMTVELGHAKMCSVRQLNTTGRMETN